MEFSRAGAEVVIVVLGILIAFGLDSWWDSRMKLDWEFGQLALLRDEAQSNVEHIESVIDAHKRTAADVQLILTFATKEPFGEFASFKNGTVSSLIQWRTSEMTMGALDALLASGELGEISNPEIRTSLTAWKSMALDAQAITLIWSTVYKLCTTLRAHCGQPHPPAITTEANTLGQ
jgi:hypothetical protein